MTCPAEEEDPFPADDGLFSETFSQEVVYTLMGEQLKITQVFGANLGVAAPVWEAVRARSGHLIKWIRLTFCFIFLTPDICAQAVHLCRYLEDQSVNLKGKRIIELGAGTGLVGILAARLGMALKRQVSSFFDDSSRGVSTVGSVGGRPPL